MPNPTQKPMNIYLVKYDKYPRHYDTYRCFVCYAHSFEEALATHPSGDDRAWENEFDTRWVRYSQRNTKLTASILASDVYLVIHNTRIICASFDAG